jgi:Ras GTPase-activating-like protein IQGAP2/3
MTILLQLEDNWPNGGMSQLFNIPDGGIVSRAVTAATANIKRRSITGRASKYYSVSVFYSMATEQDDEIEDELAQGNLIYLII